MLKSFDATIGHGKSKERAVENMLRMVRSTRSQFKAEHFKHALEKLEEAGKLLPGEAARFNKWEKLTPKELTRVTSQTDTGLGSETITDFGAELLSRPGFPAKPAAVAGDTRVHAHHIVMKGSGNTSAKGRVANNISQDILAKHNIDWYADSANLTWARNRGFNHDDAYAIAVKKRLEIADAEGGKQGVIDALNELKKELSKGGLIR